MKCPKCQYERKTSEVAPESECPSCGIIYERYKPRIVSAKVTEEKSNKTNPLLVVVVILIVFFIAYSYGTKTETAGVTSTPSQPLTLQEIHNKVAEDAVAQYRIVEKNGSMIDICVHAGLVAAAYVQAQNESAYSHWKTIEKKECADAGISK